jgi:hypothetical protein
MIEILKKIIDRALDDQLAQFDPEDHKIESFSDIEGEPNMLGVEMVDGSMFFITIEPA